MSSIAAGKISLSRHMNQWNRIVILILALVMVLSICYTYGKGLQDGEQNYKSSHRMYMALKSAYHYGYADCKDGRCESWEGDCE